MGETKHEVVIAIFYEGGKEYKKTVAAIEELKEKMSKDSKSLDNLILGPAEGINGCRTYVFRADGSKEGWETSFTSAHYRWDKWNYIGESDSLVDKAYSGYSL